MITSKDLELLRKISILMEEVSDCFPCSIQIRFDNSLTDGEFLFIVETELNYKSFSSLEEAISILESYPNIEYGG